MSNRFSIITDWTLLVHSWATSAGEPLGFDGQGWLFALNLWLMTAGAALSARLFQWMIRDWLRHRKTDKLKSPAGVYRWIGILFSLAVTLRCTAEAVKLWGWAPSDPQATLWALHVKPFVDPFSLLSGLLGLALFTVGLPGMMSQLRRKPLPIKFWPGWRDLRGPVLIVVCTAAMSSVVLFVR